MGTNFSKDCAHFVCATIALGMWCISQDCRQPLFYSIEILREVLKGRGMAHSVMPFCGKSSVKRSGLVVVVWGMLTCVSSGNESKRIGQMNVM